MGVPMYAGVTGYYYSDNFDGDYEEYNIGADWALCLLMLLSMVNTIN